MRGIPGVHVSAALFHEALSLGLLKACLNKGSILCGETLSFAASDSGFLEVIGHIY